MRHAVRAVVGLVLGLALAGCYSANGDAIRRRAGVDFRCNWETVEVDELGANQFHARGCGREGLYTCTNETCHRER